MIYRILIQIEGRKDIGRSTVMWPFSDEECFALGFYGPGKNNRHGRWSRKSRFYFTELGYEKFGKELLRRAKGRGYKTKVIRRKNPKRSDTAYWDQYQVALLPTEKGKRKRKR